MATITTILGSDNPKDSRTVINTNFSNLNTDKAETSALTSGLATKVTGPASSTDNALVRFDSTTGKLVQNGTITESDNGTLAGVNSIQLNTSPTVSATNGQMYWDSTEGTVSVNLDTTNGVTLSLGTEQYIRVVNKTGVQINDGQVVYINSAQGNRPTATLARADALATSKVIGVATQNIANNAEGFVTTSGEVHGYNTTGFTAGDILYLSSSTAGGLTNVAPTTPNFVVYVGVALNSTVNGTILVKTHQPLATSSSLVDNSDLVAPSQKSVKSYVDSGAVTMTNKSISLGSNTITTTMAQLDTAVTDGNIVYQSQALGTPASGNLSNCTVDGTDQVGFRNCPINSQSAAYTLVLSDAGKTIYHPSADTTARTWTIPANSSVAFPVGTIVTFENDISAGALTIAITTDTLVLVGAAGTTGSRTLAAGGRAVAQKVTSTRWRIDGNLLT